MGLKEISPLRLSGVEAPSQMCLRDLKRRFDRAKGRVGPPQQQRKEIDGESWYAMRMLRRAMSGWAEVSAGGDPRIARVYWERRLKRQFLRMLRLSLKATQRKKKFKRNVRRIG